MNCAAATICIEKTVSTSGWQYLRSTLGSKSLYTLARQAVFQPMVEISDSLRLLFETSLESEGNQYVIPIPTELVEDASLTEDETYRITLFPNFPIHDESHAEANQQRTESDVSQSEEKSRTPWRTKSRPQNPPVEEGEVRSVSIDTLGDQGDGIAKVERGFIVIVSGTHPGGQVDVEITNVKDAVAFTEPIGDATVRSSA